MSTLFVGFFFNLWLYIYCKTVLGLWKECNGNIDCKSTRKISLLYRASIPFRKMDIYGIVRPMPGFAQRINLPLAQFPQSIYHSTNLVLPQFTNHSMINSYASFQLFKIVQRWWHRKSKVPFF